MDFDWSPHKHNISSLPLQLAMIIFFAPDSSQNPFTRPYAAHSRKTYPCQLRHPGWLNDGPALKPVWITFGSEMSNCIGVQFGRQANYTLRVGGTNNVDTQIPRIQGWGGYILYIHR